MHLSIKDLLENKLTFFGENKTLCIFVKNHFSEKNNYIVLQSY